MIKDSLDNAKNYFNISDNLKKGFEWIINNDLKNMECGKYIIDGEKKFANVQEYETKSSAKYEAHKKYIDIQYMIDGKEFVGVTDKSNCSTCTEYDAEKDLEFMDCNIQEEFQTLKDGEFLVFFPNDAHKPSLDFGEKQKVKKVVVKVAIN